jgi:hypothetical protein
VRSGNSFLEGFYNSTYTTIWGIIGIILNRYGARGYDYSDILLGFVLVILSYRTILQMAFDNSIFFHARAKP